MDAKRQTLCRRCEHFPAHKAKHAYYGAKRLCLFAFMGIDCTRWRLWNRWT